MEKSSSPDAAPVKPYVPAQFGGARGNLSDAELKELCRKAEAEGFKKGYGEGFAKALQEGQREIASRLARLDEIVAELEAFRSRKLQQLMPDVVELAVEIAGRVIRREIETDREVVGTIALEAVKKLGGRDERMIIRVNPEDYETMISKVDTLRETSGVKDITIEPSAAISPGGCFIETQTSEVDARIEEQIKELRDVLSTAIDR